MWDPSTPHGIEKYEHLYSPPHASLQLDNFMIFIWLILVNSGCPISRKCRTMCHGTCLEGYGMKYPKRRKAKRQVNDLMIHLSYLMNRNCMGASNCRSGASSNFISSCSLYHRKPHLLKPFLLGSHNNTQVGALFPPRESCQMCISRPLARLTRALGTKVRPVQAAASLLWLSGAASYISQRHSYSEMKLLTLEYLDLQLFFDFQACWR